MRTEHAESCLIIYGNTEITSVKRDDNPSMYDNIRRYIFKLQVGEDGPVVFDRVYVDHHDLLAAEHDAAYKITYNAEGKDYEDARVKFQTALQARFISMFTGSGLKF